MKITKHQRNLLRALEYARNDKLAEGKKGDELYGYIETPRPYKPFSKNTLTSLEDRGLLRITERACNDTVFYAVLTPEGLEAVQEIVAKHGEKWEDH